jgi:hypothetical protein
MKLFKIKSENIDRRLIILLPFIQLIFSCQGKGSRAVESKEILQTDTMIKDIPLNKRGNPYSYYKNKSGVENKIGLSNLENGFDSLQIRVWYAYASCDTSQLFLLKRKEGKWAAELYTLIYRLNESDGSLMSIDKEVLIKTPKSGWQSFTGKIVELGIASLPDSKKIAGYPDFADGNSIIVEVSSGFKYRIYSYKEPSKVMDEINEARKIEEILKLIESEFDFTRLRKI